MMLRLALLVVALSFGVGFSQSAQDAALGKWVGRITMIAGRSPDGKPIQVPQKAPAVTYFLTLTKDGKFLTVIKGTPDKRDHTSEGTWKRTGTKIVLSFKKRDGKPDTSDPRTRTLTVSKDGKSMSTPLDGQLTVKGPNGEAKLPPGFVAPSAKLTFTRA